MRKINGPIGHLVGEVALASLALPTLILLRSGLDIEKRGIWKIVDEGVTPGGRDDRHHADEFLPIVRLPNGIGAGFDPDLDNRHALADGRRIIRVEDERSLPILRLVAVDDLWGSVEIHHVLNIGNLDYLFSSRAEFLILLIERILN